jgi:hypothetical protein
MDYRNNNEFENESSALIVVMTVLAIAVSFLGILMCIK